jgi:hypothetical protein
MAQAMTRFVGAVLIVIAGGCVCCAETQAQNRCRFGNGQ